MSAARPGAPGCSGALGFPLALAGVTGAAWLARLARDPVDIVGTKKGQVCPAGKQCLPMKSLGYDWSTWDYDVYAWIDTVFVEAFEQQQEEVARRLSQPSHQGATPTVLHVGAHDPLWGLCGSLHRDWQQWRHRAVLVEPDPSAPTAVLQNLTAGAVEVVRAALTPTPAGSSLAVYSPAPRLLEDMPLLAHTYHYLSRFRSTNRSEVEAALERECRKFRWLRDCASWRDYVDASPARGLTPAALLAEAEVASDCVFALLLDAAGDDLALLEAFLLLQDFAPALIVFKHKFHRFDEVSPCLQNLAAKGYDIWFNGLYIFAVARDFFMIASSNKTPRATYLES